jgi:hypothetical protein
MLTMNFGAASALRTPADHHQDLLAAECEQQTRR